jgi:hypothetical protein
MAAGDDLIQALSGGTNGTSVLSALQSAQYRPIEDPLGIGAISIARAAPDLVNPYASTGSNIAAVTGAGLVSALLAGLARNSTDAQNLTLSGLESQYMTGDPANRPALLAQEPRLGALQNVLLAQALARQNKVDDLRATLPIENAGAVDRARALAPITLQSDIAKAQALSPIETQSALDKARGLSPIETQAAIDKARGLAPIDLQSSVDKANALLPTNLTQHQIEQAADATIALRKEMGQAVDPLTGAVSQLFDPTQKRAEEAGAVKGAEMAAEQPYKDKKPDVAPGMLKPEEIGPKALEIGGKIANSPAAQNLTEAKDRFNAMLSLSNQDSSAASVAMIKNFAKILDPRAVIRESTFDIVADPGSPALALQDTMNELKNGGRLSPEHRSQLISAAMDNLRTLDLGYRSYAQSELGTFGNVGGDPSKVSLLDPPNIPDVPAGFTIAGFNPVTGKFQIRPLR